MKKRKSDRILPAACMAVSVAAAALYSWSFYNWIVPAYGAALALLFLTAAAGTVLFALQKGRTKQSAVVRGLAVGAAYTGVLAALTFLINNVLTQCDKPWLASLTVTAISFVLWLCWGLRFMAADPSGNAAKNKTGMRALAVILSVCLLVGGCLPLPLLRLAADVIYADHTEAVPVGCGTYTEKEPALIENADLYVSPDGSDEADGSFSHPLATIEKARDLVRAMDKTDKDGITVALKAGEYRLSSLAFTVEDSGTENCPVTYCAYGDGEVVLNGGVSLDPVDFTAVTDEATLARLNSAAKQNVVCTDLTKLGLTAADWGKLYPVGEYGTAKKYDGDTTGPVPCALYYNGVPMTTARYPDSGFLKVKGVVREGEGESSASGSPHRKSEGWDTLRNPKTTIFTVDKTTAERINGYATLDNVWLWTALRYNWADCTVPLKSFDYTSRAVECAYSSRYGAVADSDYYIFNVIEELDSPGEWYLDRDNGMLYLYPEGDPADAELNLSVSTEDLVTVEDAAFLRFAGLTVTGTRGGGMRITGNDVTVRNCTVTGVSGIGVDIDGYRNTVFGCELSYIGGTGVYVKGGDRDTLTPGKSRVENCLIHHASWVALTQGSGAWIYGVGNVCAHNEFRDLPQQAIFYGGNNNLMEYNLMHDVALLSDDCSAMYCGKHWDCNGSVVRYNVMYDLGDKDHAPNGIYWDDGMSGQTAYGNLIVNCKGSGFLIGGGRDHNVYNNVLVNCKTPIGYDDRSREAVLYSWSWFTESREGGILQQWLEEAPWRSETWLQAYPYTADWSLDYTDTENPNFIPNPAKSKVSGNLIVHYAGDFGHADESVYRFSDLTGNAVYKLGALKKLFVDPANGDYTLRSDAPVFNDIPDFEPIPLNEVGRY